MTPITYPALFKERFTNIPKEVETIKDTCCLLTLDSPECSGFSKLNDLTKKTPADCYRFGNFIEELIIHHSDNTQNNPQKDKNGLIPRKKILVIQAKLNCNYCPINCKTGPLDINTRCSIRQEFKKLVLQNSNTSYISPGWTQNKIDEKGNPMEINFREAGYIFSAIKNAIYNKSHS
ncbi:MAG: hypothetical protein LBL75_02950 [Rickettsiales bacterium]|jgi:hypothetical protein|nr:hypothetical protein [Rickettsiales bacterium]